MHDHRIAVVLTMVLAGVVKGVTGMGLPTVSMGLLGLFMTPADAVALLIFPSLITNVWQFAAGPRRAHVMRRTWTMLLAICAATVLAAGWLTAKSKVARGPAVLGVALVLYALVGLGRFRITVSRRAEPWLSPLVGAATGTVAGVTGVFVIPAVPYIQALGLDKEELVQTLGLSFTVSTIALALGLAGHDALHVAASGASALCTLPALIGMQCGQRIRVRVDAATFRLLFFAGLLALGADLALRPLI